MHVARDTQAVTQLAGDEAPAAGVPGLTLVIVSEGLARTCALPAHGSLRIGRAADCDVAIDAAQISRRHALITVGAGGVQVQDLGSTNGTRVRDRLLRGGEGAPLAPGDVVEVGGAWLMLQRQGAPAPLRPPASTSTPTEPPSAARRVVAAPVMQQLYRMVDRIAAGDIPVLITGETGAGKEVVAERLHHASPRSRGPFVRLNCAALTETLAESELFGHLKGAFTGADRHKTGLLEAACGGTIFLDEMGELPLALQAKLLRVVEEGLVTPVGAVRGRPIDVRFVSATNRDLAREIAAGRFREDLFFRLSGVSLWVPPLRERIAEIEPLARAFAAEAAARQGRAGEPGFTGEALAWLARHPWPGNVRELRNVVARAVLIGGGEPIDAAQLAPVELEPLGGAVPAAGDDGERRRVLEALARCHGNQTRAARLLGMARSTLVKRLEAYQVPRPRKAS